MIRRKKYAYAHPRPMATVDMAVFSVAGGKLRILLVKRGKDPYKGRWALPGGFVDIDEEIPLAAARELEEETGLTGVGLEMFGVFGAPGRDPRGRTISTVYLGVAPFGKSGVRAGDDAAEALWHPAFKPPSLAFDHDLVLKDARARLRETVLCGDGAFRFLPPRFNPEELKDILEAVLRKRIPDAKFKAELKRTGLLKSAPGGLKRLCRKTLNRLRKQNALFRV